MKGMEKTGGGVYLVDGSRLVKKEAAGELLGRFTKGQLEAAHRGTMSYPILEAHNQGEDMEELRLKFDALVGQDMTYMGVLQTAIASGVREFPVPFVLSSCHNALCYLNGTSNEDDHVFAMGAAKKYGGVFLPAHLAVMHQYMREMYAGGGTMILGADSHTRYGALGTLATGEGAGSLQSSSWAGPTTSPAQGRRWFISPARRSPGWGPRTWPWPSSARCSGTAL